MTVRSFSPIARFRGLVSCALIAALLLPHLASAAPETPPSKFRLPSDIACANALDSNLAMRTETLRANCLTSQPLIVPSGWTLDGDGHTIFATEPVGGRFVGGVVVVYDGVGTVRDVTIDGSRLTAPCLVDQAVTFLSGVLFADATGAVTDSTVRNLHRQLPDTAEVQGQDARMSCGSGITVFGAATPVLVARNRVSNVGNAAVWIEGGAATVSHNTIDRATDVGILALLGAEVRIGPGNQISNSDIGIQFESAGTTGSAAGNAIESTTRAGIAVILGAEATITDTTLRTPGTAGITVEGEGSQATVERTTIDRANAAGIRVNQSSATLSENTVTDTKVGIIALAGAKVQVTGNSITATRRGLDDDADASRMGIVVDGETTAATITDNQIERMVSAGISIQNGAEADDVSANTVLESGFGIGVLGEQAAATLSDNTVAGIEAIGLTVEAGATAELRDNLVTHAHLGVLISGAGTAATLTRNRVERTTEAGIILQAESRSTVSTNNLIEPGAQGIQVTGIGTEATISDTIVSGAMIAGILVHDGAAATVGAGNRVLDARLGISIAGNGTVAAVTGNILSGVGARGIMVSHGAEGTVRDNEITGGDPAILIEDHRRVTVEDNTIHGAEPTAILIRRGHPAPNPAVTNPIAPVSIVAQDISYAPREVSIPADRAIVFFLRNEGAARHSFVIDELDVAIDLAPGQREQIAINAPAGSYEFYCHIPGHSQAGMVGTLTVGGAAEHSIPEQPFADAIRRNTIDGGVHGIVATGGDVAVAIEANRITGATQNALSIEAGAQAELRSNIVSEVELGLNIAGPGTTVTAEGTSIYDSVSHGVHIQNGATADLRRNVVTRAGESGIVVNGSATAATLTGNIISHAAKTGISIERSADATIGPGNLVNGGTWGIAIIGMGTTAEVRRSQVRDAANQGIAVVSGAQATVEGNTVSGGEAGIYVRNSGTRATIARNAVSIANQGIYVWDGAVAEQIADNTITGSLQSVVIAGEGTEATVSGNRIIGIAGPSYASRGITVSDGATADIVGNRVTDVGGSMDGWAIVVRGPSTAMVIENEISDIAGYGIQFSQGAQGTARDNSITATRRAALRVLDAETDATLTGNMVREPGTIGVEIVAAAVTMWENTVAGASGTGIELSAGARVDVAANTLTAPDRPGFRRNGTTGISAGRDVTGDIRDNGIAGYGCGILITADAPNVLAQDNVFPDPGNDIAICDERVEGTPAASSVAATPLATPLAESDRERGPDRNGAALRRTSR